MTDQKKLETLLMREIQSGDFESARVLLRAYAAAWALKAVRACG